MHQNRLWRSKSLGPSGNRATGSEQMQVGAALANRFFARSYPRRIRSRGSAFTPPAPSTQHHGPAANRCAAKARRPWLRPSTRRLVASASRSQIRLRSRRSICSESASCCAADSFLHSPPPYPERPHTPVADRKEKPQTKGARSQSEGAQNACRQRPHNPHSLQWLPCCTTRNENLNKEAEQQHKTI